MSLITEPSPPDSLLIERDPELATLGRCLAALCIGGPSGSSVGDGEAGVGKTTLLRAAARRRTAASTGYGVPASRCCRRRLSVLWSTGSIACRWLWPPRFARGATPPTCSRAFSRCCAIRPSPPSWWSTTRRADSATLDLLRYVGRRIERPSALLILSYRDDSLASDHPLLGVLAGLSARSCIRMALAPLSRAGVAEMARRAGRSARGLYDVTQGNPFFVTELLAGDPQSLPASVRDAVFARVAPMPPEARDVIELAGFSPTQIEVEVLETMVQDARASIAQCTAARLLGLDGGALASP